MCNHSNIFSNMFIEEKEIQLCNGLPIYRITTLLCLLLCLLKIPKFQQCQNVGRKVYYSSESIHLFQHLNTDFGSWSFISQHSKNKHYVPPHWLGEDIKMTSAPCL